jgi:hypothetical protein
MLLLTRGFFLPWIWRWHIPPKCQFSQDRHGATSLKTAFFIVTTMKTLNPSCTDSLEVIPWDTSTRTLFWLSSHFSAEWLWVHHYLLWQSVPSWGTRQPRSIVWTTHSWADFISEESKGFVAQLNSHQSNGSETTQPTHSHYLLP